MNLSIAIILFGLLVTVTNLIVQLIKGVSALKEKPTRIVTIVIAIILTLLLFFAVCQILTITILWYYVVAMLLIGIAVAYVAIFGYDNVYGQVLDKLKELLATNFLSK